MADTLVALVEKSLALLEEREGTEGRYRLLEPVRQYAGEQLAAAGREAWVRGRHLTWCVALAEEADSQLTGPEQGRWLDRLELEHDNLRAGLAWSLGAGAAAEGVQLAGALWRFWEVRGHISEGRPWLREALFRGDAVTAPAAFRARALDRAGNLAWAQGDLAEARVLHEESLALWHELGDRLGIARSLGNLGNVASQQEDYAGARALYEGCLILFRELGETWSITTALSNLGEVAREQGVYEEARALHEESLAISRQMGSRLGIARSLANLGSLAFAQGDLSGARALHEESLALRHELGNRWAIAESLEKFALLAGALGQPRRAAQLWGAVDALRRSLGTPRGTSQQAEYDRAVAALRAALGEDAYDVTWAAGQSMPLGEAIALALEPYAAD